MELDHLPPITHVVDHVASQRLREYLLSSNREARVQRELWYCNKSSYLAYRKHLSTLQQLSISGGSQPTDNRSAPAASSLSAAANAGAGAQMGGANYSFHGMRFVFDESKSAVTALSFAKVRSDLLAFASYDGDLWFAQLGEDNAPAQLNKAPKIHAKAILCLDWSFDNSMLLTAGLDGGVCIWETSTRSCIRSIALREGPIFACRFHPLNPNQALLGMSNGRVNVANCSAGTIQFKIHVATMFEKGLSVTAIETSNHHVFIGDSQGWLHVYSHELGQKEQSHTLKRHTKFRVYTPSAGTAPAGARMMAIMQIQYVPFCLVTDTPILIISSRDSMLSVLKIHEKSHTVELQQQCATPPMARDIRCMVCPLSVMQDVPKVVMGGEDTNVYIYNIADAGRSKPVVVNTLKGHHAPVSDVSWAFDESLLATADCDGMVIVWKRAQ